jgi:DNA-binding response OmpR family regulator
MTKHDRIESNVHVDNIPEHLDQALRLCKCSVQVKLPVQDISNAQIDVSCDVIILLSRSAYDLESHVVSMACRRTQIPVILYLSDYDEVAELIGLRTGAHDVLSGTMTGNVIAERIMAVHKRHILNPNKWAEDNNNPMLAAISCWVYLHNNVLWCENESVEFTKTEIKLLEVLLANWGDIVTRNELAAVITKVGGSNVNARTVDSHIKRIRQKISESGKKIGMIKSVYGVGYRYIPPDQHSEEF